MPCFAAFQFHGLTNFQRSRRKLRSTTTHICSLNGDEGRSVRFRKESADAARTSFKSVEKSTTFLSPNERILAQVQESMERLGVTEKTNTPAPRKKVLDYSHVNPFGAFAGASGAALISVVIWNVLQTAVNLYSLHPYQSDIYVLNRITTVIRTAVVGLLALGSGISGVTSIGLLLLFVRVSANAVSKAFDRDDRAE